MFSYLYLIVFIFFSIVFPFCVHCAVPDIILRYLYVSYYLKKSSLSMETLEQTILMVQDSADHYLSNGVQLITIGSVSDVQWGAYVRWEIWSEFFSILSTKRFITLHIFVTGRPFNCYCLQQFNAFPTVYNLWPYLHQELNG